MLTRIVKIFTHDQLRNSDLLIDAIYEGQVSVGGEAISSTLPGIGNLGGFRVSGHGDDRSLLFYILAAKTGVPDV